MPKGLEIYDIDSVSSVVVPTPILRIVHINNLSTIIKNGVLCAKNHAPSNQAYEPIHDEGVQGYRGTFAMPVDHLSDCPSTCLHDYVPFYFGPRSPMLYVNSKRGIQSEIVYLVLCAQDFESPTMPLFLFSDGQANKKFTAFFDDLKDLDKLDWKAIYAMYWQDTRDDGDIKRRKQAEFLVYQKCPFALVRRIITCDNTMRERVSGILQNSSFANIPIEVVPSWYY